MPKTIERLLELKVGDVMTSVVQPISDEHSMAEVARVLTEHNISGAPVVDHQGICIGVISSGDFVKRESQIRCSDQPTLAGGDHQLVNENGPMQMVEVPEDRVRSYMTRGVQTISPDSPLLEAARRMSIQHIHRLPVIDEGGRPVGILTTTDLVAVIVNIAEEMEIAKS